MKKTLYSTTLFFALLLSGCTALDKTAGLMNFVKTYAEEDLEQRPDWTLVKVKHVGAGAVGILAYKDSANAVEKFAAQHRHNFRATALIFPDERNFIAANGIVGSKSSTIILNDIEGLRGQIYILNTEIKDNKFIIKSLINSETGQAVRFERN